MSLLQVFIYLIIHNVSICSVEPEPQELSYTQLNKGNNIYLKENQLIVIKNNDELLATWNQAFTKRELPEVNFKKEMIIMIIDKEQNTGGFSIEINSILKTGKNANIRFTRKIPGKACMVIQQVTKPYIILKVEKSPLNYTTTVFDNVVDCN